MTETLTKTDMLINSIMEYVPQVTFVLEQIGQAINIAKENYSEAELEEVLKVTVKVAKYAKEVSNSEAFFKYHLIVISLLQNIEDMSKLSMFETQSNKVINGIQALNTSEEDVKAKGWVRATVLQLANLYNTDQDLFAVSMLSMQEILDKIATSYATTKVLTNEENIAVLRLALVEQTIRMNKYQYLAPVSAIMNNILVTLNKKFHI